MKSSKLIEIRSLDIAVFIVCHTGLWYSKIVRHGEVTSSFFFPDTKQIREARYEFLRNNPLISIQRWLAIRAQIKADLKTYVFSNERSGSIDNAPLYQGQEYYYVNPEATICMAYYGNTKLHNERLLKKNVYRNRDDAQNRRNAVAMNA